MALEDNKVSNLTIMCWDRDGRLNTPVFPDGLKVERVSSIIPKIEDLSLIKGLVFEDDGWKQYVRIGKSLYLNNDEVKKYRARAKKALTDDPILTQIKAFLKEQGFEYSNSMSAYDSPLNSLDYNLQKYLIPDTDEYEVQPDFSWRVPRIERSWVEISPKDKRVLFRTTQSEVTITKRGSDFELQVRLEAPNSGEWADGDFSFEGFTKANFEKLKKVILDYKAHLKERIDEFKKFVESKLPLLDTSRSFTSTLSKAGWKASNDHQFTIEREVLDEETKITAYVYWSNTFTQGEDFKLTFDVRFEAQDKSGTYWWSSIGNRHHPDKEIDGLLLDAIFEDETFTDINEVISYVNDCFKKLEDALKDDEISFDGHESLSLTEAFKRLKEE